MTTAPRIRGSAAIQIAVALVALPASAFADPGEQAISLNVGYGTFSLPDHSPSGTTLGVDFERSILADVLWLRGSASGGVYFEDQRSYSGNATLGVTYHLDILRFVPYASAGAGAILIGGGAIDTDVYPLIEVGGGLEFRHNPRLSYGVQLRFETLLEETSLFTAGARVCWRL